MKMCKLNVELLKADLAAMKISHEAVGKRLGKSRTWLGNILAQGATNEETIRRIEEVLFKPEGYYEIKEEPTPPAPSNGEIVTLLQEIVKTLAVMRAQNEEIIGALHSWRKTNTEQTANLIERSKENITQAMKIRSAIERAGEK